MESKISFIQVLSATNETSQVWAVLKLFCILLEERKQEEEEFVSTRPVGFAAGKNHKNEINDRASRDK